MLSEKSRLTLTKELDNYCEQLNVPGMALLVSHDGRRVYENYYGYRNVEKKLPVTGETVFGVASITKSFAALAIMQLQDAGKLAVTDKVQEWVPNFRLPGVGKSKNVTIHHLMTHTAGLPGLSAVHQARSKSISEDPHGSYLFANAEVLSKKQIATVDEMIDEIQGFDVALLGEPGEMFNYSNESYAILQSIIEKASGMDFIKYMDKYILEPLAMGRSTFLTDDLAELSNVTELYAYKKGSDKEVFHSPTWWDVGNIYTNGSLKSSASDIMNYAEMYRQKGTFTNEKILSSTGVDKMIFPHVTTPNGIQYGYGFIVGKQYGHRVFGHGGGIKGVSTFMMVVPEKRLSLVVLMNIADAPAENMAVIAMKHLLQLSEDKSEAEQLSLSKRQLNKYVGRYESMEGQKITVKLLNERLTMIIEKKEIQLKPIGNDKFLTPDYKKVAFIVHENKVIGIFRGLRYIEKVS